MSWINGDIYKGSWVSDNRQGKGKIIWANGSIYEGNRRGNN